VGLCYLFCGCKTSKRQRGTLTYLFYHLNKNFREMNCQMMIVMLLSTKRFR
jgi:hypothetical protein